jgi:hypothetical protein
VGLHKTVILAFDVCVYFMFKYLVTTCEILDHKVIASQLVSFLTRSSHCRAQTSTPLSPALSQMHSVHMQCHFASDLSHMH